MPNSASIREPSPSLLAVGERINDAPPYVLERLGVRPDPLSPSATG
ncbi:hypothetical protein [Streptomyces sp. NPDC046759]